MLGILAGAFISAILLCMIMYLVARHEAEYSFPIVMMVAVGLNIALMFLQFAPPLVALVSMLSLTVWALHQFCYLRWSMAGIVTAIYMVCQLLVGMALHKVLNT